MNTYKLLAVTLVFLLAGCQKDTILPAETYNCNLSYNDDSSDTHPKRLQFIDAMKKLEPIIPGVQVSVRSKDGNIWTGSQGYIDINNEIATKNCSQYLVASVSKTFISVLILQLQEEGILSIDDPIKNWIDPELVEKIENADQVNIKNLLMHTSGFKEYSFVKFYIDRYNESKLLMTPTEKLKYIFNQPAKLAPNTKYDYCNTNYVLLGLIIEKALGIPLDKAVKSYITDPLGMENTAMGTVLDPIPDGTARPYLKQINGPFIDVMDFARSDAATGDGGIISNTQDLLHFIESVVDNTLISKTSYELMLGNKVEVTSGEWYGLGIEQENRKHGFRIMHTGGVEGYQAYLLNYPDSNVSIAVCINSTGENLEITNAVGKFMIELQEIAFE